MIKELFTKMKLKKESHCGIISSFFIKGKTYKVKENFMSKFSDNVISEFNKNEVLEYMGSFLDWYDSEYIVTFKFNKIEYKSIYIHESYCDLECEKCKSDTQLIAELQSYEKYFERID